MDLMHKNKFNGLNLTIDEEKQIKAIFLDASKHHKFDRDKANAR